MQINLCIMFVYMLAQQLNLFLFQGQHILHISFLGSNFLFQKFSPLFFNITAVRMILSADVAFVCWILEQ